MQIEIDSFKDLQPQERLAAYNLLKDPFFWAACNRQITMYRDKLAQLDYAKYDDANEFLRDYSVLQTHLHFWQAMLQFSRDHLKQEMISETTDQE